jgi:hypothetical protein
MHLLQIMYGDIPSVYPLKKVGASEFQISGRSEIWEIDAIFPNNQYASFTTLTMFKGKLYHGYP